MGKLGELQKYLVEEKEVAARGGRQNVRQLRAMLGTLSEQMGIPLKRKA